MLSIMNARWLQRLVLKCLLLGASGAFYGCGGEEPTSTVTPDAEDAAATAARNQAMEDFMSSPEGRASARAQ